ncbi:hypothetical protein LINPERHAP1_LOCUS7148 [Linum perenne]
MVKIYHFSGKQSASCGIYSCYEKEQAIQGSRVGIYERSLASHPISTHQQYPQKQSIPGNIMPLFAVH